MIQKRYLVDKALSEIGLAGYIFDMTPEEQTDVLSHLDGYMGTLKAQGIDVGYNFGSDCKPDCDCEDSNLSDDSGLSQNHLAAIWKALAVEICPMFGKTPSIELKVAAKNAHNAMLTSIVTVAKLEYPSTYPMGAGNRRWRRY